MVLNNDTDPVELAIQSWIMYSVGMAVIVLRLGTRVKLQGLKGLQADDYVMCVTACLYTLMVITLNRSVTGVGGNGFPADEVATWTESEKQEHSTNAIYVQVAEQATLTTIYSVKVCMLLIYSRLTMGLKERFAVKLLAVYVALGFATTEIVMFTVCRPFNEYWAVPTNNVDQCAFYRRYSVAQACFNISSDIFMLGVPLPLLIRSRLPTKQKVAMVIIFSMGSFVVLAAIMSKTFGLLPKNIDTIVYAFWYLREASVAVYVANLPLLWPLIRFMIKVILREKDTTASNSHAGSNTAYQLKNRKLQSQRLPDEDDNSSQERIVDKGIFKDQTFEVRVSENEDPTKSHLYDERQHGGNVYKVGVESKSQGAPTSDRDLV